jgi:hypothetical protein
MSTHDSWGRIFRFKGAYYRLPYRYLALLRRNRMIVEPSTYSFELSRVEAEDPLLKPLALNY